MMKTSPHTNAGRRIALFAGSFDPFTVGHQSVVNRALPLFDEIVIAIGENTSKQAFSTPAERKKAIEAAFATEPKVRVVTYSGLTVDEAKRQNAQFLLRGVRTMQDFEYEMTLAQANRDLCSIETVLLYTLPEHAHISSSLVRELAHYDKDITPFLPK